MWNMAMWGVVLEQEIRPPPERFQGWRLFALQGFIWQDREGQR